MAAAVGYATLPVIPSARGFGRALQREINAETQTLGAEVGTSLGAEMGDHAGKPLGAKLADSLRKTARDAVAKPAAEAGETAGKSFSRSLIETVDADIKSGFRKDANGRWRDANGRFAAAGAESGRRFVSGLTRGLRGGSESVAQFARTTTRTAIRSFGRAGGAIGRAVSGAAMGGLGLLRTALTAILGLGLKIVPAFSAIPSLLLAAGGLAGSLFTIVAGGAASIGVLRLGLRGVGDALGEVAEEGKASKETLKGLSKNARAFVREFERIQKPLGKLRRAVQDKLFSGLDKSVRSLATRWLPALKPMLGDLAGRFNGFAKTVFAALGKPDFVANIRAAVKGFGGFIDSLALASKPFIDAVGRLAKASVPFVKSIGDGLAGISERFAKWVAQGEKTGKLQSFMDNAVKAIRDIGGIGKSVIGIAREIYTTFFPDTAAASESFLSSVRTNLDKLQSWLADPANKQKVRDFVADIKTFISDVKNLVADLAKIATHTDAAFKRVEAWGQRLKVWGGQVKGAFDLVKLSGALSAAAISGAINSLAGPLRNSAAAFGRFRDAVSAHFDGALAIVRGFPGRIVAALGNVGGLLYGAGRQVVAGLAAGMRSNTSAVTGAGSALGRAARTAAEQALKIKSPSRVFMQIGAYTAEGMARGIERGQRRVTRAVGALTAVPDPARITPPRTAATSRASSGDTHYHLHNSRATLAQLEALQRRQAVLAHIGRPY
ncbi:hypothetical protein AB0J27_20290 [Micromonospora chokoriensis]